MGIDQMLRHSMSRQIIGRLLSMLALSIIFLGPLSYLLIDRYVPFSDAWPLKDLGSVVLILAIAVSVGMATRRFNRVKAAAGYKERFRTLTLYGVLAGGFWLLTSSLCVVYDRLVGASISECREGVEIYTMGTQGRSPTYIRDVKSNELIFEFRSLFIEIPRERGVYPAVEFEYRQGRWVKVLVAVRPLVSCSSN